MIGGCKACDRTGVTLFRGGHCLICTETRDRFAAVALGAILGHHKQRYCEDDNLNTVPLLDCDVAAVEAYEYADAMMIERARNAEERT